MQVCKKFLACALCLCLIAGMLPTVSADSDAACTAVLTGNTGAVVTCAAPPLSAAVDDNALAIVEIRDNQVRVIANEGAVGVARLTVQTAEGYEVLDIPVGYTTFVFDGGKLTVIPGSGSAYEISGINAAGTEYLVGDAEHPLPVTTDPEGRQVYENSEDYKLCVNVKKTGGSYVFTGTGTDGSIAVKKAATGPAVLLLAGLDLSSSFTAPITVKKDSTTTVTVTALAGWTNTLADAAFNNADNYGSTEDGGDGSNANYAESAVIKAKSGAKLTLNGEGVLNLDCATKNAVKVGENGSLTLDELTLNVNSVKNGISSDNVMVVNGGSFTVTTADGDAIRSDPDAVDAAAGCAGTITINGGSFRLYPKGDGIQAAQDLTVNGGSFTVKTGTGYNDSSFNGNTMSWKGLKASANTDDSTEQEDATNTITINGGSFDLNTADDAIHSDGYVVVNGGEFTIQTGDDGVHADNQADFGATGGADCAVHLTVGTSYEGLEAKNLYVHSGCYQVIASDDGINAAGGSSNGSDPGPWNPWNPGPGGGNTGDYELVVSGGMVNVNAGGDGLDSNGNESLTGGSIIVWGAASNGSSADNSPLDCDGTLLINGATVFAAGSRQMAENPGSGSQPYVRFGSSGGGPGGGGSSFISSGKTVVVKNASSQTVFSIKAPKTINYALYSAPTMNSSSGWSISGDNSTPTATQFWTDHSYGSFVQTTAPSCTRAGVRTATCSLCGNTVTQAAAATGHEWSFVTVAPTETAEGYRLYTCAHCGGQYRTDFTDPTGDPDPCADGHSWDDGSVTQAPTCTEAGERTYTCTVCGDTSTEPIDPLGHDFNDNGVCTRCGLEAYRVSFLCSDGCSVTVYPTQSLADGGTQNAAWAFPRSGSSGVIDISGDGQVNFVVQVAEGYTLQSVAAAPTANYKNLKTDVDPAVPNSYRLTKVKDAVTVTVTAAPVGGGDEGWSPCDGGNCPGSVFQDMPPKSHWAHDSIDWAYTQGISSGTGSNSFSPNRLCTRAEIMTFLWRAAGSPEPEITESPFTDLKTDSYYYKAVLWAVEQGITAGTSETTFSPHKTCTRAEAISFLWHALGDPEAAGAENPFRDVKASDYFYQAVLWAAGEGVSSGTAPDRFSPDSICTRAQILTFLYRAFV